MQGDLLQKKMWIIRIPFPDDIFAEHDLKQYKNGRRRL